MKISDLVTVRNGDIDMPRNTYLTPVKAFDGFIKGELIWVRRFEDTDTIVFRPMDGKEYTVTEKKLKYFELTGR
jgi:hypothetical protein